MVNLFTKEFAIAGKKGHPYIPFVTPELRRKPRRAPLVAHARPNKAWMGSTSTKIKDPPHQVSLQAWLLYSLGYILTGGP